jgi:hypothetical protein
MISAKRIAKEWLIFVGVIVGAWALLLAILLLTGHFEDGPPDGKVILNISLTALAVYTVVLIARSIVWAVKTIRKP